MKQIKLLSLRIQNFKGCKDRTIEFGQTTRITGDNGVGKSTVFDAYLWLLFDKNSKGVTNFAVRPLTESGETINNIEISVEATISVDNDEYKLRKTQKQKWVKKRGTDTREFQGNVNEFDINGYPKSQKEFKEFISGIVNEEVFPLISNPAAFTSLPWKEQRDILMQFVGDVSDVGIAETFGEKYLKLIPELKIANTDDILKKYTKAKNTLNKDMVEIPARIDEASKQLVIADVGALEVEKAAKEVALQKVEDEISGGNSKLEGINSKREEIMNLKLHLSEIQNAENQKLMENSKVAREKVAATEKNLADVNHRIAMLSDEINATHSRYEAQKTRTERLSAEWKAEKIKAYPALTPLEPLTEDALICPTCGQALPEEIKQKKIADYESRKTAYEAKYVKDKESFEKKRAENLARIEKDGKESAALRDELKAKEEELRNQMAAESKKLAEKQKMHNEAKEELNKYPITADVSENAEYLTTIEKISVLEKEIESMSSDTSGRTELEAKKAVLKDEIAEIAGKILAADNTKAKERIAELEKEQKEVGQKIAEQEQMIDLVEDFIRTKMNMISEKINGMFSIVSFKLFDNQINGGLKETCTCTVKGVGHSDVNDGHEIVAGLDIINTFSEKFGVRCPIFIDRAGELNEIYIPEMDNQLILLKRVDNQEFKIESEDK